MLLTILFGTYGGISSLNYIIPLIKKRRAKKEIIRMFEENGYDVDEHYINILFKKYDIYKNKYVYEDMISAEKKYWRRAFISFSNLYDLGINIQYLLGDYSNIYNRRWEDYYDFKSYTEDFTLECLECDKIIKTNPFKMQYVKDKEIAKKELEKQEINDIDLLKVKYEDSAIKKRKTLKLINEEVVRRYGDERDYFKIINND